MLLPFVQKKGRQEQSDWESTRELPVLPLRNVVAFPHALLPLAVGLPRSVRLLEDALDGERLLVLTAMTDSSVEEPGPAGVYQVGTLAQVERAMRLDDGNYQIVVRGLATGRINVREFWRVVSKEFAIGLILGVFYAVLIGTVAQFHYAVPMLATAVGLAVIVSMTVSALVGSGVPLLLARINIDPAVATGPFVTTSIDIISVYCYFILATMLLGI